MKAWYTVLMVLLLVPLLVGIIEVQVSLDNITFENVTDVKWGGAIDDVNDVATARLLNDGTLYHFRAKDAVTEWSYSTNRTEFGESTVTVPVMTGMLILGVALIVTTFMIFLWRNITVRIIGSMILSAVFIGGVRLTSLYVEAIPSGLIEEQSRTNLLTVLSAIYAISVGLWIVLFVIGMFLIVLRTIFMLRDVSGGRRREERRQRSLEERESF